MLIECTDAKLQEQVQGKKSVVMNNSRDIVLSEALEALLSLDAIAQIYILTIVNSQASCQTNILYSSRRMEFPFGQMLGEDVFR